jgi:CHAT domain-containing protein
MGKWSTPFIVVLLFCSPAANAQPARPDFQKQLQEADRLAWLTDWSTARPIYSDIERAASAARHRRDSLYAKFGRLRGQMQMLPLVDISEEIARDLETPLAKQDPKLRLRGLTVKGDIDLEWNIQAADRDWQQVRQLARELGDKGWENRANGELGMIAFLKGNTGEATTLVRGALETATQSGDVGGQLRYMGSVANGLFLAGYAPLAMGYVDRALKFSSEHPEAGFPFVVYSTKVLVLMAVGQADEAERFAKTALAEARAGDRRIKEIELSMMLAQIADKRGQKEQAVVYLERAAASAKAGNVQRLYADAEEGLAEAYRARRDLGRAITHALSAVRSTELTGARFTLPKRLGILAEMYAAQGKLADADHLYDQAADIIEGIMVNVPTREAQARLIGVMSELYTDHFRLVADRLKNPGKAYQVMERARGRALADVLRAAPDTAREDSTTAEQTRTIARLQLRLMKARAPVEREQILDALWDAEQHLTLDRRPVPFIARSRVGLQSIRQHLASGEVLAEYVLTEPHSYCLTITRSGAALVELPARKQIEELADQFVNEIRSTNGHGRESAAKLYDAVIRPIAQLEHGHRVFVVPDGKLHLVPFDSLVSVSAAPRPILTTVPSASVFFVLRTRARVGVPERPLLAVGGVPYDRMSAAPPAAASVRRSTEVGLFDAAYPANLPVLASAQAEVQEAARLLGPASVVLTGDQATESALKAQNLSAFEILHFAVHAFADPKFPERAALVLLNDPATGDDGLLQPREIGRFKLNAGVVVLSACDTSVGPTLGQEGVLNLARAFVLAGAQSVITTLWAVSDNTSTALMRRFYENLTAGEDVAEALAHSKETVLERFGSDAIAGVAAFQVVGVGDQRLARRQPVRTSTSGHVQ